MIFEITAPYLQDPLILVGFALSLFFGLCRLLLRAGIIPPLPRRSAYNAIRLLLTYGFILALAVIVVGSWLKNRELSEPEQRRSVRLVEQELKGNIDIVHELAKNIETILRNSTVVIKALRHPGNRLVYTLFPAENTETQTEVPAALEYARQQMLVAQEQGLLTDKFEKSKFGAVGEAIAGTIDRTMSTSEWLADVDQSRYPISSEVWEAQLPILRQVQVIDVTKLQSLYQDLARLRANYTVSVNYSIDYLRAVRVFFDPEDTIFTPQRLAAVLAAERIFLTTIVEYANTVVERLEGIENARKELMESDEFE